MSNTVYQHDITFAGAIIIEGLINSSSTNAVALSFDFTTNQPVNSTLPLVCPNGIANTVSSGSLIGSISGALVAAQTDLGTSYKKVVLYCDALLGTATYTFTTAFTYLPGIVTTSAVSSSVVTSLSTSAVTITGSTTTGFIFLEGF